MIVRVDPVFIPITLFVVGGAAIIFTPLARAMARRMDRMNVRDPLASDDHARLERMEQAIEAIAVEVERISEGQRFTTKLLSDRAPESPRAALPPTREPGER